jgi:hypothetical protein
LSKNTEIVNDSTSRYKCCVVISQKTKSPVKNWGKKHENIGRCLLCNSALKISEGGNGEPKIECYNGCTQSEICAAINRESA